MKKYQELEAKIAELQKEVERLKQVEEGNQLPGDFCRKWSIKFLFDEDFDDNNLDLAFTWKSTPQGEDYWQNVYDLVYNGGTVPQDAIIAIQRWIIQSYREQYGD